jgi:nicotinamide-nucleotide amidase
MPDLTSLASPIATLLKTANQTVAVAESSGGGLISAALVSIPGASAYYVGGGVIYTGTARRALLRVEDADMTGMRASTEPYALLKARTIRAQLGATWGLSETGASGPTGNRYGDAAGHACIAVTGPIERSITVETGSGEREANMWTFAKAALDLLQSCIKQSQAK